MNRRSSIGLIFNGIRQENDSENALTSKTIQNLDPFTGSWTIEHAAHLLRRTCFGPTRQEIELAYQDGLEGTLEMLFRSEPLPAPPINHSSNTDPFVPLGSTWIDAPYVQDLNLRAYRTQSLYAWTIKNLLDSGLHIREKMTLFWHNHYATEISVVNDPKFQYRYISLLRENATGNFRELTKKVTIDLTMLRYLNGNQNTKNNPNENYARELLELFTIGKGAQVGPGDYTNYTEDDVLAIAKVLTGWRDRGYNTTNPEQPVMAEFRQTQHDMSTKVLSHRFDNQQIPNLNENEYSLLIDIIFEKDECAFFIARKLYRWFVYYEITPDIETEVIQPLAELIISSDYNLETALKTLLGSNHFYEDCYRGAMIKHPIDYVVSMLRQFGWTAPGSQNTQYRYFNLIHNFTVNLQMAYYNPPGVSGWKAWYQEPAWYQVWINSVTLPVRADIASLVTYSGFQVGNNPKAPIPVMDWLEGIPEPQSADSVIAQLALQLFAHPLAEEKKNYLKEVLLPGLPDYEWTIEYLDYKANPDNEELMEALANKLRNLIATMMQMPEYHLC